MNKVIKTKKILQNRQIKLIHGDITDEKVDAIVNAANSYLKHGAGVAGAIVRKGGQIIQQESDKIGFVPAGQAAITGGGELFATFVIHAVGPRWGEGNEDDKLSSAVYNTLLLADKHQLRTISIPAISAGIFGFPKNRCAQILLETIQSYLGSHPKSHLMDIRICILDEITLNEFVAYFSE
jgi:O-acetyl-ADP-ribose deacetylase (regulator of RNase III)